MKIPQKPLHVFALLAVAVGVMLHGNLNAPFYYLDDMRYLQLVAKRSWAEQFRPEESFHYAPITYLSLKTDMLLAGVNNEYFLIASERDWLNQLDTNSASPNNERAAERKAIQELTANALNWAWVPRLMNGVYHAAAGFLLWMFLSRLGAGAGISLFVSFIWTAHPAALESVAWVCERKNVMCALWGFASLLAWTLPRENRWRWPLVTLFFAIAMLSKVAAFSLVPVLCALEFFDPIHRAFDWRNPQCWMKSAARLSPILLIAVVGTAVQVHFFKAELVRPPGGSAWTGLLTDADIFARYTLNSLVPFGLSFLYGVESIVSLGDVRFWKFFLPLAAFWLALFHFTRREERMWTAFGFVWFFGALGPNANIVASSFPMQDRYTYLPMPGLLIALAFAAKGFADVFGAVRWLPVAGCCYAAFILAMCGIRSPLFNDSYKLIENAAQQQPKSRLANVTMALMRAGEMKNAMPSGINPDSQRARAKAEDVVLYATRAEAHPYELSYANSTLLRLEAARALQFLDRNEDALEFLHPVLKPWQPPVMTAEALKAESAQAKKGRIADQWISAEVWSTSSEILLRLAADQNYSTVQQQEFAQKAIAYADQFMAFFPPDHEKVRPVLARGQLLRGKGLLRLSEIHARDGKQSDAERDRAEGIKVLQNIEKQFGAGEAAQKILKELKQ